MALTTEEYDDSFTLRTYIDDDAKQVLLEFGIRHERASFALADARKIAADLVAMLDEAEKIQTVETAMRDALGMEGTNGRS